jgi:hypothetical protein
MSSTNGANKRMIKPWGSRCYNRYSKRPPNILRQRAVSPTAFSRTRLNMLALAIFVAAWNLATRSRQSWEELHKRAPTGGDHRTKLIGGISGELGGHTAINPSSWVTFRPSIHGLLPHDPLISVVLWPQLLPHRGTTSSSPSTRVSRKSRQCWVVGLSGSRQEPTTRSQVAVKMMTLKRMAGIMKIWLLWTINTGKTYFYCAQAVM